MTKLQPGALQIESPAFRRRRSWSPLEAWSARLHQVGDHQGRPSGPAGRNQITGYHRLILGAMERSIAVRLLHPSDRQSGEGRSDQLCWRSLACRRSDHRDPLSHSFNFVNSHSFCGIPVATTRPSKRNAGNTRMPNESISTTSAARTSIYQAGSPAGALAPDSEPTARTGNPGEPEYQDEPCSHSRAP